MVSNDRKFVLYRKEPVVGIIIHMGTRAEHLVHIRNSLSIESETHMEFNGQGPAFY